MFPFLSRFLKFLNFLNELK
uniref:Uncharacterized protein n=1 Tax=Anguilla anguilla TaxID=7936 RepID=A0A0E9XSG2_ANGAN